MSDNVAVVQSIYDAFGRGDIGSVLGALDDDVHWYEAEHVTYWPGGPFVGPQAVLENLFVGNLPLRRGLRIVACGRRDG